MNTQTDVALILWNQDLIELVSLVLHLRNLKTCGIEPCASVNTLADVITCSAPAVVVFDLEPPYDRSAAVAERLVRRFGGCSFVLTCADRGLALKKAPWLAAYPLFQKPYDIEEVADTVRGIVRQAPVAAAALSVGSS